MQNTLRILFVINPIAGGNEKSEWESAIRDFFLQTDHAFEFYIQSGQNDRASIQFHIERFQPDTVVAVGGDGTVKLIAEIIKETPIRLGIIPAGSANGLAKELGIPSQPDAAIDVLVNGYCKKMDAIKINEEELCFHLSDAGMNALLVKYFANTKKRGLWGYGQSLLKMFWNKRRMRVAITTDEGIYKRKAYMVVLANAEKYGTGAVINPEGDVADGTFEVVVVRKLNVFTILKAILVRKRFNPKRIEVFRTKSVTLRFQQKAPFQVDGEYRGRVAYLTARIQPGLVNVMLPRRLEQ